MSDLGRGLRATRAAARQGALALVLLSALLACAGVGPRRLVREGRRGEPQDLHLGRAGVALKVIFHGAGRGPQPDCGAPPLAVARAGAAPPLPHRGRWALAAPQAARPPATSLSARAARAPPGLLPS